ncbi:GTPase Era [Halarsenatibacter silvermanii]|uniref:GTPase Era n=1 Tax=Halarsenatibacter silvermanii TaxID=321763 RepID=A0A1G9JUI4_9FIRM|nr:GTPase Era [Halarsenatibacter silvermanii]SDL41151.1 GTP-binding protein Era [Halarsenatibacter silvermanii]
MGEFKSGFVSVLGRPNVGKSSLINALIGEKAGIVSRRPQTTRRRSRAILTGDDFQAVFLDTPGVHKIKNKLDEFMLDEIEKSMSGIDLILLVCDVSEKFGPGDEFIYSRIESRDIPAVLILNKIDLLHEKELAERIENYEKNADMPIITCSARRGTGKENIMDFLRENLPEGPQYYPDGMYVDKIERELVEEFIREQIFELTWDEIPYGTAVRVEEFEEKEDIIYIRANIFVEQKSHKGMIIGEEGSMLRKIGKRARQEIEKMMQDKVYLDLWVKEKKDWRKKEKWMKNLGYEL